MGWCASSEYCCWFNSGLGGLSSSRLRLRFPQCWNWDDILDEVGTCFSARPVTVSVSVSVSVSIFVSGGVSGAMLVTSKDEAEERILSSHASTVRVRVIETDEDARANISMDRRIQSIHCCRECKQTTHSNISPTTLGA